MAGSLRLTGQAGPGYRRACQVGAVLAMQTVLDVIKMVLPDGSNAYATGWDDVCEWPPDLFAAAATIAERSGLYSDRFFTAHWADDFVCTADYLREVQEAGVAWRPANKPPPAVVELWKQLIRRHRDARIDQTDGGAQPWKIIVFKLLAIADEACAGVGFPPASGGGVVDAAYAVYQDYLVWADKRDKAPAGTQVIGGAFLPFLPHSLCLCVPPASACVQPKTNTPAVGCTLRSLTHHLALLPSIAHVQTHWRIASDGPNEIKPFNILAVPFPYSIPGKSFAPTGGNFPGSMKDRAFRLQPEAWMHSATAREFADFLIALLEATSAEVDDVHAVVLPETALPGPMADEVARLLAAETRLELLLAGVVTSTSLDDTRNIAAMYRFKAGKIVEQTFQSKHHRWRLDGDQIRRYNLGHVLDPHLNWWEKINVSARSCYITVFRPGAALSVLICEDLARYDPVLTVMNAIGPNLVIGLLMDGPQLEYRWPGRYAMALADDPGSAVLTLTSLGMVERSHMPGEPRGREVALWKQANERATPLRLPAGDHALLLTLTSHHRGQLTFDGRDDGNMTVTFGLGAARGIRHPDPPSWVRLGH